MLPTRSDTNWALQPQKKARRLTFLMLEVEGLYYLCTENQGAYQPQLICAFVFAYAKSRFSHDATHFILIRHQSKDQRIHLFRDLREFHPLKANNSLPFLQGK